MAYAGGRHRGHVAQAAKAAARRAELADLISDEGLSFGEAAERLGVSQQRVSQMWQRILKDMQDDNPQEQG